MQIATAYYGFREQTPTNYFEMAAALGIRYVEIPMYAHIIKDARYNLRSVEAIDALRATAEQAGVTIVASVSNLPLVDGLNLWGGSLDASTTTFALAAARRVIDIAAQLGIRVARITEPNVKPEDAARADDLLTQCGHILRGLAEHAAERGVQIVIENYGIHAEQLVQVLQTADHPQVGALYDPCNFYRMGDDPLAALHTLRDHIHYVHLKDARRDEARDPDSLFVGSRWSPSLPVGAGEIAWQPILHELSTFYTGYIGIEYEMPNDVMRGTRSSLQHIQRIMPEVVTHG